MAMPVQKPGRSKQDYCTPPEFIDAVLKRLGVQSFYFDLAATAKTKILRSHARIGPEDNSLLCEWSGAPLTTWNWLNPPYADIGPWVAKAHQEARLHAVQTAMLIPASVGANWWATWVHNRCYVLFPRPRLQFVGTTAPYPKDCALLLYSRKAQLSNHEKTDCILQHSNIGYDTWKWKD